MAAIAFPERHPERLVPRRPDLRVLPPVEEVVRRSERAGMAPVYRRRRAAAVLISVVVLVAALWAVDAVAGRLAAGPAPAVETSSVERVVQPGDTYWSIALELGGSGDVRERVDALVRANGGSASLEVGQRIVVPGPVGRG